MDIDSHIKHLLEQKNDLERNINLLSTMPLSQQLQHYLLGDEAYRKLASEDPFVTTTYREGLALMFSKITSSLKLDILSKHLLIKSNIAGHYPLCELRLVYPEITEPLSILYINSPSDSELGKPLYVEDLFGATVILDYASLCRSIRLLSQASTVENQRAYQIAKQNDELWTFLSSTDDTNLSVTKGEFTDHLIKLSLAFKQTGNDLCKRLGIANKIVSQPEKIADRLYRSWRIGTLQNDPIVITARIKYRRLFQAFADVKQSAITRPSDYQRLPEQMTEFFKYLNDNLGLHISFQYTQVAAEIDPAKPFVDPNGPDSGGNEDLNTYLKDLLQ